MEAKRMEMESEREVEKKSTRSGKGSGTDVEGELTRSGIKIEQKWKVSAKKVGRNLTRKDLEGKWKKKYVWKGKRTKSGKKRGREFGGKGRERTVEKFWNKIWR